jgi:hypothetical protein
VEVVVDAEVEGDRVEETGAPGRVPSDPKRIKTTP